MYINEFIPLAGDSIYLNQKGEIPIGIVYANFILVKMDAGYRHVNVYVDHDREREICGDSAFEKAISDIIGHEVKFAEIDTQENGTAHLRGRMKKGVANKWII